VSVFFHKKCSKDKSVLNKHVKCQQVVELEIVICPSFQALAESQLL